MFQEMEIKKCAKEGNNDSCKILAKQLVQLRKQKTRMYAANSKVIKHILLFVHNYHFGFVSWKHKLFIGLF